MNCLKNMLLVPLILLLGSCALNRTVPSDLIIGSWRSDLSGFVLSSVYSATYVSVDGYSPVPYVLLGDRLVIDGDETSARIVSFPSRDQMVQTDPLTDVRQEYRRSN